MKTGRCDPPCVARSRLRNVLLAIFVRWKARISTVCASRVLINDGTGRPVLAGGLSPIDEIIGIPRDFEKIAKSLIDSSFRKDLARNSTLGSSQGFELWTGLNIWRFRVGHVQSSAPPQPTSSPTTKL